MGQMFSTPSRYRAPQLLLDKGIPCVIWAEDALAHYGVPAVSFDLFLLVHDPTQAAKCLTGGGFIRMGSNERYKLIPPLYEGVLRFVDPANRELALPSNMESCIALLSAQDWGYILPSDTVGLNSFPPLNKLFDSLAHTWLDAPTSYTALHFFVHVGYLFEYVPAIRDPAFRQTLRPEHRPFYDSNVAGGLLAVDRPQHRQRRDEILLQLRDAGTS
ncbi:MAG: hypothetical protein M1840_001983 [Geoglossum simile]|nr:MAG: hypothetical protein M1840_001983 [Geoglossum simile]